MRPLPFAILALIALVLQVSLVPAMAVTSAGFKPQLLLVLAMFVALYARPDAALLGCWTLGLLADLSSIGPLGGFAFGFGLAGLGIVATRASLFRDHPLSHFFLALSFGFLANEIVSLRDAVYAARYDARRLVVLPLGAAAYTALIAPYLMLLLNRFRRVMRLPERV
jgi:rod shape-determining protein MreD